MEPLYRMDWRGDLMEKWKELRIDGIVSIEKCVSEFNVWEQRYSPYAKFKIKIFESNEGKFTGVSNLQVKDATGHFYCAVGFGKNVEEALKDTIDEFFKMVSRKSEREWDETDFECSESFDF